MQRIAERWPFSVGEEMRTPFSCAHFTIGSCVERVTSGLRGNDRVAAIVAGGRRARSRRSHALDARADREVGAREWRAHLFADREWTPLRDLLHRAIQACRSVSRDEAGARGLQSARGLDPALAALLQHGRRDGESYRGVGRPVVASRCRSTHQASNTNSHPKMIPKIASARMLVGVGMNSVL